MKKIFFITISILLLFSIFATFNNTVYASSLTTEKTLFSGLDDSSININNSVKITNNTEYYDTNITFIVHGINSSAAAWSNELGTKYGTNKITSSDGFSYNPNSIIECLRRRCDANVYLVEKNDSNVNYITSGFYLKSLIVDHTTDEYYTTNEYYIDEINDVSKHIVVVYDASCSSINSAVVADTYNELEYVINKITYNVCQIKESKVKINLIGHSRGGIINMMYATNYPYNVDGLFSIGTPYIYI